MYRVFCYLVLYVLGPCDNEPQLVLPIQEATPQVHHLHVGSTLHGMETVDIERLVQHCTHFHISLVSFMVSLFKVCLL